MGYLRNEDYNIAPPTSYNAGGVGGSEMMAMSNPAMAGLSMGGSLISGYLAQKAAEEKSRRENAVKIAQNQADGEINSMKFLDNVYRGALL